MPRALPVRARPAATLAATAAAALLAIAGCGGGDAKPTDSSVNFQGKERAVAQAVEAFETAGRAGDAKRICTDLMATQLRQRLQATGGCEARIKRAIDEADGFDLTVRDVAIVRNTARAAVVSRDRGKEDLTTMSFVLERKQWRLAALT